jgi:hypothetical protein
MTTRCVFVGKHDDRLAQGKSYVVFEVDFNNMRIRIDDLTGWLNWYPAELFDIDLMGMSEVEADRVRETALRVRVMTTRDEIEESCRSGVHVTKRLLVKILESRGVDAAGCSIEGLWHMLLQTPSLDGEGRRAYGQITACNGRLKRIGRWLGRITPKMVATDRIERCCRLEQELNLRWRVALHELAGSYHVWTW